MKKIEMIMPQMGESITEATISKWLKNPGDHVNKDEVILEISTDKVDSEIPAPATGLLAEVKFTEGAVVPVKSVIAIIDENGAGAVGSKPTEAPAPKAAEPTSNGHSPTPQPSQLNEQSAGSSDKYYSPLVKSLAEKHGVSSQELDQISGSGQGGRVNKADLMDYIDAKGSSSTPAPQPSAPAPTSYSAPAPQAPAPVQQNRGPEKVWDPSEAEVIPMDNMRKAISEHMVRSKHTSPHVYSVQEVDMSNVSAWRKRNKNQFSNKEGFNLSFTPFFLEAAVKGLLQFPMINSSVDGQKIIMKKHINLGCAVALGTSGLIVPVIKRAEERNIVGLARSLNELADKARNKKLVPDDIAGGTFTVTNPGVFGTMIGTPIINQPQVAILCLGAIKKRPVVIDDMIAIREVCYLTLSYDHRIIDGSLGGQYLKFLREYLENWDMNRSLY